MTRLSSIATLAMVLLLAGCGTAIKAPSPTTSPVATSVPAPQKSAVTANRDARSGPPMPAAGSGRGGYYQDDGPGEKPPEDLQSIPDAVPKVEPYATRGNKPYAVFGKNYTPLTHGEPFKQRGMGSWYGKKFHGQKTSSGELYDMYKMSAAHPTLPIPSYARVTNVSNGAQVIVRVNDRGPFHSKRIIDLSYTAALKLGYLGKGSTELEVERLLPDEIERIASNRPATESKAVLASIMMPTAQTMTIDDLLAKDAPVTAVTMALPAALPINSLVTTSPPSLTSYVQSSNTTATAVSNSTGVGGVFLQLGSYSQSESAVAARAKLLQNWPPSLPSIDIVQSGTLYRLYTGPFSSRTDAASAAIHLQDAGIGLDRPFIVQR